MDYYTSRAKHRPLDPKTRPHGLRLFSLLPLMLLFLVGNLSAQTITGTVVDSEESSPLVGVGVIVKGTTVGTYTDENGAFSVQVPDANAVLIFRSFGFADQEVALNGQTSISVTMLPDGASLGEVVLIGYGTQKKEDLTGSIVSISSEDFIQGNVATPEQLINGKVPGVQISLNSGQPGAGSRIRIRGGSSLNASNDPLIVIDGVPVDNGEINGAPNPLSLINPNDIETFTVLKDASATAIYGSRASNGVILITTKTGKAGQPLQINVSSTLSRAQITRTIPVLTAEEFRQVVNEIGSEERQELMGDTATTWQDLVYREAYSQDYNVSLTGAIKSVPVRASVGYFNQNGVLLNSNMRRTSASVNVSPSLFDDHLRINVNLKGALSQNQFADQGAIGSAVAFDPTQPVFSGDTAYGGYFEYLQPNGNPNTLSPRNPLAQLNLKEDNSDVVRSVGSVVFDYRFPFLPDLRANLNLGYDFSQADGNVFVPANAALNFNRTGQNKFYEQYRLNKTLEFYLNYAKDLEAIDSRIDVMGGYSFQDFYSEFYEEDLNLASPPDTFNDPILTPAQNTLMSFYTRVNYTLKDRYLLTATMRADGSSRFSPATRWGYFPSVALAWKMNEEAFIQNLGIFSNLKLRLGYGLTGQQDGIANYPYLARYTPSEATANYQFGDQFFTTLRPEGYDANIRWESTTTYNAGLDFGFANDRITASIDYYVRQTKDLLSIIPVPAGSNFTNQLLTNVGNIENTGLELTANFAIVQTDDWQVNLGANFTLNRNEITNLTQVADSNFQGLLVGDIAGGVGNTVQIHSVGFPTFTYFLQEQVYDDQGKPIEGEYVDRNGDGEINLDDRYRFESPNPDYFVGMTGNVVYKGLSLSFVLRGNIGAYVYNNLNADRGTYRSINNSVPFLTNMTQDALYTEFENNQYFSDYYLEPASFLRMDNLVLAYSLNQLFGSKLRASISLIGQNVFVITNYSGLDPEVANGIDNNIYPIPRTFSLGINLTY